MTGINIDGNEIVAAKGDSILDAAHKAGIDIPTICHDSRCAPIGSCRLCLVEIDGQSDLKPACQTRVEDCKSVTTTNAELERYRRTEIKWFAAHVARENFHAYPDKALHRLMRKYDIEPGGKPVSPAGFDVSMPQIRVDLEQCINCNRCVRICDELQGDKVWHEVERGAKSHIVPKQGALLSEGGCVACGACVDTCPTAALVDVRTGTPDHWTRTTCTYCGVGCELDIGVAAGQIVTTRPSMSSAVNKGHACAKGRYGMDFVRSPDRIIQPQFRGPAGWRPVNWETALDACATALGETVSAFGPNSVGVLASSRSTNEDSYLAQKFARLVIGTNNVDCCARVCHTPTAAAMKAILGAGAATNSFDDLERAATILVSGANPVECHPVIGARIRQQKLRGDARLIVIDPRQTALAEIADIHLSLQPGTDIPLQNAIAHTILAEDLYDEEFIANRVDDFQAYAAHVAVWTPERAADVCKVPADLIRAAARLYAVERPGYCAHGLGVTEHVQGTEGVMGLVNLALITGNIGRPGAGINPLRGQNNVQGTAHMGCDPGILAGAQGLKEARPAFEAAWGNSLPSDRGLNLMEMIDAAQSGNLKALVVIGYDIAATLANESEVRQALAKIDPIIIVDLFMTETALQFGHYFLPAASALEKDGTFMNAERRIQRIRKVLDPPGAARADWDIICALAARMGYRDAFSYSSPEAIWNEIRSLWPDAAGIQYDRLDQAGLQWPCPDTTHPGTEVLHQTAFGHGPKARLRRLSWHASPEIADSRFPLLMTTGRNLFQFNVGTMTRRTANQQLRPTDRLDISPADGEVLGLSEGESARIESRYGSAELPVHIDAGLPEGRVFSTFHDPARHINRVTSPHRDRMVGAPEYKLTAVRVRPIDRKAQ